MQQTPNTLIARRRGSRIASRYRNPLPATRPALLLALIALGVAGCAGHRARTSQSAQISPQGAAYPMSQSADATLAHALQDYYRDWHGVPYRYGGRDRNGIDCSSFVRRALAALKSLTLPRTTSAQAHRGEAIDRSDLSAGDLVFFKTGAADRHVGIYIGDGRFMHASSSQGVTLSRLDNSYWRRHYWQSRRVVTANR